MAYIDIDIMATVSELIEPTIAENIYNSSYVKTVSCSTLTRNSFSPHNGSSNSENPTIATISSTT